MGVTIRVRGGRAPQDGRPTRGQDLGVFAVVDGKEHLLRVSSLVMRVMGRTAIATVELAVDEIDVENIEAVIMGRTVGDEG